MTYQSSAIRAFTALGDPTRRAIFESLSVRPSAVGELATQFPGAVSDLQISALYYLGAILLVIGVTANLGAVWISRKFDANRNMA